MGIIKPLPESVRNCVRSGIILSDITRLIQELIFNSLDASSSKISVFIGIGTSYVKVVDDGSGITRDGLVLLGQRYVTSKYHHLLDMDMDRTFGFRGEALASISDVSLLEILTKACGMANGYRKIIKGCNCLYLGIDDDRQDVGTTVVVRDLFYNQPVRRKYMQSSPKKVLHEVKKCVLRIALMHPKVSFKIVDTESESNLLSTHPCSSTLSLLRSGFGSEVSSSLHELKIGDGNLKLSGYICSPFDNFSIKAVQYVYINKRFICKGQIHKLLNHLASRFACLYLQTDHGFQSRKRSRSQTNPAYILNLDCPGSLYDLTLESSKTFVHFKDWTPILSFIEEAIQQFWEKKYTCGEPLVHPIPREDQLWKDEDNTVSKILENVQPVKKSKTQSHQASLTNLFSQSEMLTNDDDFLHNRLHDKEPCENLHRRSIELNEQQMKMEICHQADHFLKPWKSLVKCSTAAIQNNDKHAWEPDYFFVSEDSFFDGSVTSSKRCVDNVEDDIICSVREGQAPKMHINMIDACAKSSPSSDLHEFSFDDNVFMGTKPFLRGCSSGRSFPLEMDLIPSCKLNTQNDIIRRTQMQGIPHVGLEVLKHDSDIQDSYFCEGTSWQDKDSCSLPLPRVKNSSISEDVDFLSKDFVESITYFGDRFVKESSSDSRKQVQNFFSSYQTINSPCTPVTSNSILATDWEVNHFIVKDALEGRWTSGDRTPFRDSVDNEEKGCELNHDIMLKTSTNENCISSSLNSRLIIDDFLDARQDFGTLEKQNQYKHFSPQSTDMHTCDKDFSNWIILKRDYKKTHQFEHQGFNETHYSIERSRRCHSAPPFCRRKTSFHSLGSRKVEKPNASGFCYTSPHLELGELRSPRHSSGSSNLFDKSCLVADLLIGTRTETEKMPSIMGIKKERYIEGVSEESQLFDDKVAPAIELRLEETPESSDLWIKWKNCCHWTTKNDELHAVDGQSCILDISSGFLSLAGNSLVPESINKTFLEDAKVLLQLDKKFIPVVSGGMLAVIDQHAADERIRLEDLRQKLLSGEAKTITYLDNEHELMLPEIGYQLLHNFADLVKEWGWICNIHDQDSKSFRRNLNILHKRETDITLMAVPCILGVNLSELDLLEFLHQLADTDGSSTIPPSVLRVLNSKACRGAIMFGDPLLPSECTLIVEELKQTSLCFQCAHGRPTTVPLVNLEALHRQIRKLDLLEDSGSNGMWHGLRQNKLSLERTLQRLSLAGCM